MCRRSGFLRWYSSCGAERYGDNIVPTTVCDHQRAGLDMCFWFWKGQATVACVVGKGLVGVFQCLCFWRARHYGDNSLSNIVVHVACRRFGMCSSHCLRCGVDSFLMASDSIQIILQRQRLSLEDLKNMLQSFYNVFGMSFPGFSKLFSGP